MNHELELKLQAWMDGQLPVREADEVSRLLEKDAAARTLLAELRNTRAALAGFEDDIKVPESREFFWSKIAREIKQQEAKAQPPRVSWFYHFRRLLIPAGAVAALALIGLLATRQTARENLPFELSGMVADSDTFTFTDEENGTTLIWFSYPTENEFTNQDDSDIL